MRFVTIAKASDLTGYSMAAINKKIDYGIWPEGTLWRKAPDGRRLIDMDAFTQWVMTGGKRTPRHRSTQEEHQDLLDRA